MKRQVKHNPDNKTKGTDVVKAFKQLDESFNKLQVKVTPPKPQESNDLPF